MADAPKKYDILRVLILLEVRAFCVRGLDRFTHRASSANGVLESYETSVPSPVRNERVDFLKVPDERHEVG